MVQCPSCGGMFNIQPQQAGSFASCPHCRQFIFIGLDGQPQQSHHSEEFPVEGEADAPSLDQPVVDEFSTISSLEAPPHVDSTFSESSVETPMGIPMETPNPASWMASHDSVNTENNLEETHVEETHGEEPPASSFSEASIGYESQTSMPSELVKVRETARRFSDNADLDDLRVSANDEQGSHQVRLVISLIDDLQTREAVFDAIVDSRLDIQRETVEARIHQGELALDPMSPVQASVIVKRLKFIGVQVAIEQLP